MDNENKTGLAIADRLLKKLFQNVSEQIFGEPKSYYIEYILCFFDKYRFK